MVGDLGNHFAIWVTAVIADARRSKLRVLTDEVIDIGPDAECSWCGDSIWSRFHQTTERKTTSHTVNLFKRPRHDCCPRQGDGNGKIRESSSKVRANNLKISRWNFHWEQDNRCYTGEARSGKSSHSIERSSILPAGRLSGRSGESPGKCEVHGSCEVSRITQVELCWSRIWSVNVIPVEPGFVCSKAATTSFCRYMRI